jgi:hypothetical protein
MTVRPGADARDIDGCGSTRLPARVPMDFILWYYYGMKVALSIPDELFESAETLVKRMGVSRSRLYAAALADYLAKHRGRKVTNQLNAVYSTEESRLEPPVRRLQRRSVERDAW